MPTGWFTGWLLFLTNLLLSLFLSLPNYFTATTTTTTTTTLLTYSITHYWPETHWETLEPQGWNLGIEPHPSETREIAFESNHQGIAIFIDFSRQIPYPIYFDAARFIYVILIARIPRITPLNATLNPTSLYSF